MKTRFAPLFLMLFLQACESGAESPATGAASAGETPVTMAIDDLSTRLGIAADEVKVVSEKCVTWPDGSLGCPKEGMMYTQAQVEGAQIVLDADGRRYTYHSGSDRSPFLCESPQKPAAKSSRN